MTSGDKSGLRPDSAEPWIPNELVPDVSIVLSEDPEEPTYLDTVKITTLENVNQVQIRVVRTPYGPEELVLADTVSLAKFRILYRMAVDYLRLKCIES